MVDQNTWEKFGEWIRRKVKDRYKHPDYANGSLVSYTGTSNAHRPLPMVEVTRSPDSNDAMVMATTRREAEISFVPPSSLEHTMLHSGFDPSSDHMPPSTGMVMLREGEMMSPYVTIGSRSPQPVKNNPKIEKSSLKKANKERMQRKMDTDD